MPQTTQSIPTEGEQKIREAGASDIGGSVPSKTNSPAVDQPDAITKRDRHVPKEIAKQARRRSLASQIREEHDGEGYVVMNSESGEIIDIVGDLAEGLSVIKSKDISSEDTLVVSCHEQ